MMIAGALCNTDHVYLYSKCSSRFLGITPDGKVQANDNSGSGQREYTHIFNNPGRKLNDPIHTRTHTNSNGECGCTLTASHQHHLNHYHRRQAIELTMCAPDAL